MSTATLAAPPAAAPSAAPPAAPPAESYLRLIRRRPLRPIRDDADLQAAAALSEELAFRDQADGPPLDDDEEAYLHVLNSLIFAYDDENNDWPEILLPDRVRFTLDESGVTREHLAEIAGVSTATVAAVLGGEASFNPDAAARLAAHFVLSPDYFTAP